MNKEIEVSKKTIRNKTIKAFFVFFVLVSLGYIGFKKIWNAPKELGVQKPLRDVLITDEAIFAKLFRHKKLADTFSITKAVKKAKVNGDVGLNTDGFDANTWKLCVVKDNGDTLKVSLEDIKKLPKTSFTFNFKCIEGWSEITNWGGVKLSDFVKYYHLEKEVNDSFVGLSTPDNAYYVGIDMPSAMHPQTILCYELNGVALPINQGYPLRLIIPVKYGVKHIKRIGTMSFSNQRPPDYWYERGYDYYSGL